MAAPYGYGYLSLPGVSPPSLAAAYPYLHQLISCTALPAQIARGLLVDIPTGGSKAAMLPKELGSRAARANRVGEGDGAQLDIAPLTGTLAELYKIKRGHAVTDEMMRFQKLPLIQQWLARLGLVIGNTVDYDIISVLNAGIYAAGADYRVACGGISLFQGGVELTKAGTIGQYDIDDGIVKVQTKNYIPDVLLVNPIGLGHIRRLPQWNTYANTGVQGPSGYVTDRIEMVQGLRLMWSSNVPAGRALILATGTSPTSQQQYSPLGYFCHDGEVLTGIDNNNERGEYGVWSWMYYVPVLSRAEAGCVLTY